MIIIGIIFIFFGAYGIYQRKISSSKCTSIIDAQIQNVQYKHIYGRHSHDEVTFDLFYLYNGIEYKVPAHIGRPEVLNCIKRGAVGLKDFYYADPDIISIKVNPLNPEEYYIPEEDTHYSKLDPILLIIGVIFVILEFVRI